MPKYKGDAYLRLSYTADRSVESDSIANQEEICQGGISPSETPQQAEICQFKESI